MSAHQFFKHPQRYGLIRIKAREVKVKMWTLVGLVIFAASMLNCASCSHLSDEYSVGTSLNKYLWNQKEGGDGEVAKRDGEKRTTALWFGPRLGKRNQATSSENLPVEILEILQKIQKSPELQNILAEKLQLEGSLPYVVYLPASKPEQRLMTPRYLRDSPDMTQNLNSRPYPPRFGRSSLGELPPYLPRLGRSSSDSD